MTLTIVPALAGLAYADNVTQQELTFDQGLDEIASAGALDFDPIKGESFQADPIGGTDFRLTLLIAGLDGCYIRKGNDAPSVTCRLYYGNDANAAQAVYDRFDEKLYTYGQRIGNSVARSHFTDDGDSQNTNLRANDAVSMWVTLHELRGGAYTVNFTAYGQ